MSDKIDAATASMIKNLEEQSGKTLAEWKKVVTALGAKKHGEVVKTLKDVHGLGHGYANLVAHHAKGALEASGTASAQGDDLVDQMYAGEKAALRPIHETLMAAVRKFGTDVEVSPKKTYVSLRRSKQFGLVQPTTKTRVDVGINLKGVPPSGRLEASGSFNAMVSHRVRIEKAADVDKALIAWLKEAYDRA
jgi:hypothetical protein